MFRRLWRQNQLLHKTKGPARKPISPKTPPSLRRASVPPLRPPPCDIPSGRCFFTRPWTVTRSSLRMFPSGRCFLPPPPPLLEQWSGRQGLARSRANIPPRNGWEARAMDGADVAVDCAGHSVPCRNTPLAASFAFRKADAAGTRCRNAFPRGLGRGGQMRESAVRGSEVRDARPKGWGESSTRSHGAAPRGSRA